MVCSSLFKTQSSTASVAAAPDPRSSYSYGSESFVSARIEVSISQQFDLQRQAERIVQAPPTDRRYDQSTAAVPALSRFRSKQRCASAASVREAAAILRIWPPR
jgi:hypothetical protein